MSAVESFLNRKKLALNEGKIFIVKFLTYLINKRGICEQEKWLEFIEYIMHNTYANDRYLLNYSVSYIEEHLSSLL